MTEISASTSEPSSGRPSHSDHRASFEAAIFDLDGVITQTAMLHARAWKKLFDNYLQRHHPAERPFDIKADYRRYVDGKPRDDGIRSFLQSRDIELPDGQPDDPPSDETVWGLGNRKNEYFHQLLEQKGVKVYSDSVQLIRRLRQRDIKVAIISASRNCSRILTAAGIRHLFDAKVDGNDAPQLGLQGKPAPDIFLEAAERLGVRPERAVVFEDAVAGVEAGKAGEFGLVVGVARNHGDDLKEHGADLVVSDVNTVGERILQDE